MKVLVCCIFVIANTSFNSRASLENFPPTRSNDVLDDLTKFSDKSCYRPCKFNVKPKRCHYIFRVEPSFLDDGKPGLTVNGITPGPPINVCANDIIVVDVENRVPGQYMAIHWHGVDQKGSPYMDGVPMVTQCPIGYRTTFRYAFVATSPGTFFYHADLVTQQNDGVYGSLIVHQPQPLEPHSSLYDYDRSKEHTILFAARFPILMTGNLEDMTRVMPEALLINGDEENTKVEEEGRDDCEKIAGTNHVVISEEGLCNHDGAGVVNADENGHSYRLRFINALTIECSVVVTIDRHEMTAIANDGRPVKPVTARSVQLYPGERIDVVVRADRESGGYWLRAQGSGACAPTSASAMLLYSGYNYTSMLQENKNKNRLRQSDPVALSGLMMESFQDVTYTSQPRKVYLGINRNIVNYKEDDIDFRYDSDEVPRKPYLPASLTVREKGVVQINGKNFLYPNAPILLRPDDVVPYKMCNVGDETEQAETLCLQILNAVEGEPLEIALVNEGVGSNESYTFHMHGPGAHVVATGHIDGAPLTKEQFLRLDEGYKIVRNIQNPPIKDTFIVPNKGYSIIRIRPERGSWLLECRSCGLSALPAAILIQVQQTLPKAVLQALPKCGNYRPPDVLLN